MGMFMRWGIVLLILYYIYKFISNIENELIMSIFYLIATVILIITFICSLYKDDKLNIDSYKLVVTIGMVLAGLEFELNMLIRDMKIGNVLLTALRIEGAIAFSIWTVHTIINFFKNNFKLSKLFLGLIIGTEALKYMIIFIMNI